MARRCNHATAGRCPAPPTSRHRLEQQHATSSTAATLANNFQTFLTLLTTQLQNQNPLDPLDTNQFTQQLVQFAGVEQQLKKNDQLATLVNIEKTTQSTAGAGLVGKTAVVDGSTAPFDGQCGDLEPQGADRHQRHHHHHQFDRPDRLLRHLLR